MSDKKSILLLASAATLALAMQQGALAEPVANPPAPPASEQPAQAQAAPAATPTTVPVSPPATEATTSAAEAAPAPVAPAPVVTAPAAEPQPEQATNAQAPETPPAKPTATTPPPPAMVEARERMEQRRAEMMQERKRRYEELRTRAAEVGLELPETPPWDQPGMQPPQMPTQPELAMPEMLGGNRSAMTPDERDARREQRYRMMREQAMQRGVEMPETPPWKLMNNEERQAHWKKMRNMTPEERQAMRDQHWQEMRQRALKQGIEMPETPPWKQAEQRRAEMKARWDSYRETLDAMTPEQKEAAQAIFGPGQKGFAPQATGRQTPPGMPMQAPYGAQGSGFPQDWGMPGFGQGRGQPMLPGRAQGWYGGDQGGYQGPPPPPSDFNQRW